MNQSSGCREHILLEVYTTVRELAERSLLLDLGSLSGILSKLLVFVIFIAKAAHSAIVTHVFVVSHLEGLSSKVVGDCGDEDRDAEPGAVFAQHCACDAGR